MPPTLPQQPSGPLKGGGHRSSPLKNLVSDQLVASNVRDGVIKFFSSIGLCKSKEYILLSSDKAVEEKIRRGWDPFGRGYGLLIGAYDNIGFRKLKGYVQYTLLSIIFVNVASLICIGVYPDPTLSPESGVSGDEEYMGRRRGRLSFPSEGE